jgi:hypothetical protein
MTVGPRQVANRLEAGEGVVVQLSQMRIEDKRSGNKQQGITIGRSVRNGFGSNYIGRPGAVLDHHRQSLRPTDLLGQKAGQDVSGTPRRDRNNDLDRSRRLRPRVVARQRQRQHENKSENGRHRRQTKKLTQRKSHRVSPLNCRRRLCRPHTQVPLANHGQCRWFTRA